MESVGIDVSKSLLSCSWAGQVREFPNNEAGQEQLLAWSGQAGTWCMEATGRFHEGAASFAHRHGLRCLVVNPGLAKKYLGFVASRGKTDKIDAAALERLAQREGENLREYRPVPKPIAAARDALVRRRSLVEARVSLKQVSEETGDPGGHLAKTLAAILESQQALEKELSKALKGFDGYERLLSIPGIGPLSAAILVCTLERGEFPTSDSIVAFAGLDPRPRDSGKHRGKRTLSHQGDAQLRTILFMAARAGARGQTWKPYYQSQRDKGLSTTEATVILARKLLRVAWKVYKQETPFVHKAEPGIDTTT